MQIIEIEGIGPKNTALLKALNIHTVQDLLEQGSTAKQRSALEKKSGISGKKLLRWIGMADLIRVTGVGKQFAELLKASGVDTAKELSQRNALNLHTKIIAVNEVQKLSRTVPAYVQLKLWIDEAKQCASTIKY